MHIKGTYGIERIESGYIVRDIEAKRAVHVAYAFEIGRQMERFFHDRVIEALADSDAVEKRLEAERLTSAELAQHHSMMIRAPVDFDPVTFHGLSAMQQGVG